MRKPLLILTLLAAAAGTADAQTGVGIGTTTPNGKAALDITSTEKGLLLPRMSQAQMQAISPAPKGLLVWCTDCNPDGFRYYDGSAWMPMGSVRASYTAGSLSCSGDLSGAYRQWSPMTSANTKKVSIGIAVGGVHTAGTDTVNGVSFRASGSSYTVGTDTMILVASGTPLLSGTFTYTVSVSGQAPCTFPVTYMSIDCGAATSSFSPAGALVNGTTYSGTFTIPYTSGNGAAYGAAAVTASGLTLTRSAGTYTAGGGGNITYTLSGTYSGSKNAQFLTVPEGCEAGLGSLTVSTIAGNTARGFADSTGSNAKFYFPDGIVVAGSGNLYVADGNNARIRMVTPAGVVTTFAGSSTYGEDEGLGTAAQFEPGLAGLAADASGNMYLVDYLNHRIRKITPAGMVSTLAGGLGTRRGFVDGADTAARFLFPKGIAADGSGNLYVADASNHSIRKITPAGVVSTVAGNGTSGYADGNGAAARFNLPAGVTVDGSGNLYVADQMNRRIRKISPAGDVTTVAGTGVSGHADGAGAGATFSSPAGIVADASGNLYVADGAYIRKITPAGMVTTVFGSGTAGFADGTKATGQLQTVRSLTFDSAGNMYITDGNRIRKVAF